MSDDSNAREQAARIPKQCETLLCCLCSMPLYPAWQFICCGVRICTDCIDYYRDNDASTCPSATCGTVKPHVQRDKGFENDNRDQQIQCPKCSSKKDLKELGEHMRTHGTLACDDCSKPFLDINALDRHKRSLCPLRSMLCLLSPYGCTISVRHADWEKHYSTPEHQLALTEVTKRWILYMIANISKPNSRAVARENRPALLTDLVDRIGCLREELMKIRDREIALQSQHNSNKIQLLKIQEELSKIQILLNNKDAFSEAQKMREDIRCFIDDIQSASNVSSKVLDSNDKYNWKIYFTVLLDNSSSTRNSIILQSSIWGYRMRISAWITEQQYMAVSFCLIKGLYDEVLNWPFEYPFSLHLVDLTGSNQHIIHTVVPKSNLEIFGKPAQAANQSWSIDQFCSLENLVEKNSRYIQDNAMFLQFGINYFGQNELLSKSS